jgi:hypothetical protein
MLARSIHLSCLQADRAGAQRKARRRANLGLNTGELPYELNDRATTRPVEKLSCNAQVPGGVVAERRCPRHA